MQKSVGNFQAMDEGAAWWNVYNIYDTCTDMPHQSFRSQRYVQGRDLNGERENSATWACGGMQAITSYFNRADVQKAIHVNRTTAWKPNDNGLKWNHPREGISFMNEIKRLAQKYPFLVYSGDVDAQIPHTSSELWTSTIGFAEVAPYQAWTLDKYVQGYVTQYEH